MDSGSYNYQRYLEGDDTGLAEIIHEYKDGLIFYLNGFVDSIHVAEELAEDTFVKLGTKKPIDWGRGSFKTWLYTIGRHIAIDYLRKNAKKSFIEMKDGLLLAEEESLEIAYLKQERKVQLHRILRQIKPLYRQVLWLLYFEGFTHKEIARIMHKSVHSVETLAYRARLALKTALIKEGFDYEEL